MGIFSEDDMKPSYDYAQQDFLEKACKYLDKDILSKIITTKYIFGSDNHENNLLEWYMRFLRKSYWDNQFYTRPRDSERYEKDKSDLEIEVHRLGYEFKVDDRGGIKVVKV